MFLLSLLESGLVGCFVRLLWLLELLLLVDHRGGGRGCDVGHGYRQRGRQRKKGFVDFEGQMSIPGRSIKSGGMSCVRKKFQLGTDFHLTLKNYYGSRRTKSAVRELLELF